MLEVNPYLALRGCMFRILSPDTIQVWDTTRCVRCHTQGSVAILSKLCIDPQIPLAAGLRFTESEPPAPLYHLFSGSGYYCPNCTTGWRAGQASIREAAMGAGRG